MPRLTHYTTDHETIRKWAEERGGRPTSVSGTRRSGEGAGILRVDFPGHTGSDKLRKIPWARFFDKFDNENLVFIYQEQTKQGRRSNFNKFIRIPEEEKMKLDRGSDGAQGKSTRKPARRAAGRAANGGATGRGKIGATKSARGSTAKGATKTSRGKDRVMRGRAGTAGRTAEAGQRASKGGRSGSTKPTSTRRVKTTGSRSRTSEATGGSRATGKTPARGQKSAAGMRGEGGRTTGGRGPRASSGTSRVRARAGAGSRSR
jgi:hypothetical protein